RLRHELNVWKRATDDEERITVLQRFLGWPGAEQTDSSRRIGARVGNSGFTEQGLHNRRTEFVRHSFYRVASVQRALAGKNGDLLSGTQNVRSALQIGFVGQPGALRHHV